MDSSTQTIAIVIAVLLVIALIGALVVRRRRSVKLRSKFGPEYDRMVDEGLDRRQAESELHDRQKRVARLDIKPLTVSERERFVTAWRAIQAEFVDEPKMALVKADSLLTDVMKARGYPMEDFEQRSADLSVDHPSVVQNYRAGHDIALRERDGQPDTENLRQAMIHYRALFDELVDPAQQVAERRAS